MEEELNRIQKNRTWELIPRLVDNIMIGKKWVFQNKLIKQGKGTRQYWYVKVTLR